LLLISVCFACTNQPQQNRRGSASTHQNGADTAQDIVRTMLPELFEYFSQHDSSFASSAFDAGAKTPLPDQAAEPVDKEFTKYHSLLMFNSDSSKAIDLYSYNFIFQKKDNRDVLTEAGPDMEIALYDVNDRTRRRLLFTGPSVPLLDAKWISDKDILIGGAEEINEDQIKPLLWQISLTDGSQQLLVYRDTLKGNVRQYLSGKLKAKEF